MSKESDRELTPQERISDGIPADVAFKSVGIDIDDPAIKLKGLRLREGLNQTEFAKMIDITQGDLSKMERGLRPIGEAMAMRIAKLFKISYQHFL